MPTAKQISSPARIAANRANARKSTGPKTAAGKARSRASAVKHGLTGAGIALPTEDTARIEAEFLQAQEDLAPATIIGMKLVHRLALLNVRLDRAARHEAAALRGRARRARADFDCRRLDDVDQLIRTMESNPRLHRRYLLTMPEGGDGLIEALGVLLADLTAPAGAWSDDHHRRLDALCGYRERDLPWSRPTRFSRALNGDFEAIGKHEMAHLTDGPVVQACVTGHVIAAIADEIASLRAHRATLDLEAIEQDRADAADLALHDASREAELARRYEAATARELSRTLRDFHLAEALADEPRPKPEPTPELIPAAPEPPPAMATGSAPNSLSDQDNDPGLASFGLPTPGAGGTPSDDQRVEAETPPSKSDLNVPVEAPALIRS